MQRIKDINSSMGFQEEHSTCTHLVLGRVKLLQDTRCKVQGPCSKAASERSVCRAPEAVGWEKDDLKQE